MAEEDDSEAFLHERLCDAEANASAGTGNESISWLGTGPFVRMQRMRWFNKMEGHEADDEVGGVEPRESPKTSEDGNQEAGDSNHCEGRFELFRLGTIKLMDVFLRRLEPLFVNIGVRVGRGNQPRYGAHQRPKGSMPGFGLLCLRPNFVF